MYLTHTEYIHTQNNLQDMTTQPVEKKIDLSEQDKEESDSDDEDEILEFAFRNKCTLCWDRESTPLCFKSYLCSKPAALLFVPHSCATPNFINTGAIKRHTLGNFIRINKYYASRLGNISDEDDET